MQQYDAQKLVIAAGADPDPDVLVSVSPEAAGWDTIHFQARKLSAGKQWQFNAGAHELALVVLGGTLDVATREGQWRGLGSRKTVFDGLPYGLYLPINSELTVQAATDCEFAIAWAATDRYFPPSVVTPADVWTEIRGGDHATRHINSILPPGFPCARLVVVEVYTPGGNWSSYPPHKHDIHKASEDGQILEADLDEIYYYKFDRPEGYAFQRIYTDPESPLAQTGHPIDAAVMPRNNDVVLVPEGYHPVSSPPGYTTYYLNVLVGSAQSLAATDDPAFAWVKSSYRSRDPRVPVYDVSAGAGIR